MERIRIGVIKRGFKGYTGHSALYFPFVLYSYSKLGKCLYPMNYRSCLGTMCDYGVRSGRYKEDSDLVETLLDASSLSATEAYLLVTGKYPERAISMYRLVGAYSGFYGLPFSETPPIGKIESIGCSLCFTRSQPEVGIISIEDVCIYYIQFREILSISGGETVHLDDGFDIVSIILWAAIGIVSVCFCLGIIMGNLGSYTRTDKTALTSAQDNTPEPYQWYVRDYLLMMMVADEFCPAPQAIDLKIGESQRNTIVKFDADYLKNMEGRLQRYYISYLHDIVDQPISGYDYYYSDTEEGRWRFYTN